MSDAGLLSRKENLMAGIPDGVTRREPDHAVLEALHIDSVGI
jgi:hypothetical protein